MRPEILTPRVLAGWILLGLSSGLTLAAVIWIFMAMLRRIAG